MGSHKEWRKIAKKERRRKIRKKLAQEKCAKEEAEKLAYSQDENYKIWLVEQEKAEEFQRAEAEKLREEENRKWFERELVAQQKWRELQEKISKARFERAQQDLKIKQEWEEQQKKVKEAEEVRNRIEEEQRRCHEELTKRIEEFSSGVGDLPEELQVVRETNPDKEICPFYSKIGICRFGEACSRNHRKPGVSKVLLAKNFYSNFGIENSSANEYDTDILLEYDDKETYAHFKEFFDEVLPEFKRIGEIIKFKVCCNFERHLRGNTYIEYATLREAVKAYRVFHGRWYAGKQINLQFCDVPSWKQAICGLFASKRCPKGKGCNFLHVFRNPGDLYSDYSLKNNRDYNNHSRSSRSWSRNKENGLNWRWSESPERIENIPQKSEKESKRRRKSKKEKHKRHKRRSSSRESQKSSKDRRKKEKSRNHDYR